MKNAFKKFKDLFFEEEIYEEIIEEDDVPVVKKAEPVFQDLRLDQPKGTEHAVADEKSDDKKSELLTIHPVKEKVEVKPQTKPQVKKPETMNTTSQKMDYEFTQVISPIYGLKDSNEAQPVTKKISPKKVSALKSPIGTVLSPMYGVYEENPLVQEVDVEPEILDMQVEDFIDQKEDEKKANASKSNNIVNLSLFDDDEQ